MIMTVVFVDLLSPLRIGLLSFPFYLAFLVGFVTSPFRGVGVLRSRVFNTCSSSQNRGFHEYSHISAYIYGSSEWTKCNGIALNILERPVITQAQIQGSHWYYYSWEAYLRQETRGFRARHDPSFSHPSCKERNEATTKYLHLNAT